MTGRYTEKKNGLNEQIHEVDLQTNIVHPTLLSADELELESGAIEAHAVLQNGMRPANEFQRSDCTQTNRVRVAHHGQPLRFRDEDLQVRLTYGSLQGERRTTVVFTRLQPSKTEEQESFCQILKKVGGLKQQSAGHNRLPCDADCLLRMQTEKYWGEIPYLRRL